MSWAKFAASTFETAKVAILRDVKSDYSVGLADVFIDNFKKMGGTIVADERLQPEAIPISTPS
jgi:branched-chain amino acid transport system substrate-binding protein